jgi:hypothetical protein
VNIILLLVFLVALSTLLAGAAKDDRPSPALTVAAALIMAACAAFVGFTLGDVRAGYTQGHAERVIRLTADLLGEGRCDELTRVFQAAARSDAPLTETGRALRELDASATRSP